LVDKINHIGLVADIRPDIFCFHAKRAQFFGQRMSDFITSTRNDQLASFLGKRNRGGAANAGECSRDENGSSFHMSVGWLMTQEFF